MKDRKCPSCGDWKVEKIGDLIPDWRFDYWKVYLCWSCLTIFSAKVRLPNEKKAEETAEEKALQK